MTYELREYQQRVVDELRDGLAAGHKRQILALRTGGGKTVIAGWIIVAAADKGHKTLFIVDRKVLVPQAVETFSKYGLNVGVLQGENTNYSPNDDVIVGTIQTLSSRGLPEGIGVVMIDEVHVFHKNHAKLLDLWNLLPVIGLSATPQRKGLAQYFTNLVRGPKAQELIDSGDLVPVRAYCPSESLIAEALQEVRLRTGDFAEDQLSDKLNSKVLIADIADTYDKLGENRQALVFACDIAHSKAITDEFLARGIPACHIDGYMPEDERDPIMEAFTSGHYQIVSSVNVLGVGFDYPAVSCAILARPTLSEMLFIQQCGRIMRPFEGKADALILDHAGNCVRFGLPIHYEPPDLSDEDETTGRQKRKQKKAIACEECGYILEPGQMTCPACGIDRPTKTADVVNMDGTLVEFGSDKSGKAEFTMDDKYRWYRGFIWYCLSKNWKRGRAFYLYKEKFGVNPIWSNNSTPPLEPDADIRNWMTHQYIKWKHGKKNARK